MSTLLSSKAYDVHSEGGANRAGGRTGISNDAQKPLITTNGSYGFGSQNQEATHGKDRLVPVNGGTSDKNVIYEYKSA